MLLLVASWYGNRDKLRPDGPLGLYVDLTFSNLIRTVHIVDSLADSLLVRFVQLYLIVLTFSFELWWLLYCQLINPVLFLENTS